MAPVLPLAAPPGGPRRWRWVETDIWGAAVHCAEETWAKKVLARPALASHEDAIRATVRDPDAMFLDEPSTQLRRLRGSQRLLIVHYVSVGRTHGPQAGAFVAVVVKYLPLPGGPDSSDDAGVEGLVQTMYLPSDLQPRLHLHWERHP